MESFAEVSNTVWSYLVVYILSGVYISIGIFAMVQFIRLSFGRSGGRSWSTQKFFLFLAVVSCFWRGILFAFTPLITEGRFFSGAYISPLFVFVYDIPALLFLTLYYLLLMFWVELVFHASHRTRFVTKWLRPLFFALNILLYGFQISVWVIAEAQPDWSRKLDIAANQAFAFWSFLAGIGFVHFGLKMIEVLKVLNLEVHLKTRKISEVVLVSGICSCCFFIRSTILILGAFYTDLEIKPLYVAIYSCISEIVPVTVLIRLLWQMPSRTQQHYSSINDEYHRYENTGRNYA